jgi:EpsI family protein
MAQQAQGAGMNRRSFMVRAAAASALMGSASVAGALLTPTRRMAELWPPIALEQSVPKGFGPWRASESGLRGIVNPQTQAKLDEFYTELLTRNYVNDSERRMVMLSVAYGREQSDTLSVHLPDVCYPAQGFEVREVRHVPLDVGEGHLIPARRLITQAPQRPEPLTYWTTVGERAADGGLQRKLAQMHYGLQGLVPDGLVFRVSTIGDQFDEEFRVQHEFVRALAAALAPAVRRRLMGSEAR